MMKDIMDTVPVTDDFVFHIDAQRLHGKTG